MELDIEGKDMEEDLEAMEEMLDPCAALRDIIAVPFNHWKKDCEWMVVIIIDGKSMMLWLEANTPEEASRKAIIQCLEFLV